MKFIDLLKEPSEEKLLKKAKAVFSALRRGKISRDNGSQVFTYELGNRTFARVKDGEIEVVGSVISIKKLTFCPLNERFMTELIENKFKTMFDINVELRPPTKDQVEEYTGKMPWEKEEVNEDTNVDKERKRVKTIHKSLRKGVVNEGEDRMIKRANTIFKAFRKGTIGPENDPNEPRFKYELSEDISITRNNVGVILFTDKIKITELNRACRHASVGYMADKIRNRFRDFGIILEHPHIDKEDVDTDLEREEELNEHAEVLNPESLTNKEIKKVKLVYNTFKNGHFVYDELSTYGYILPDDYYIYRDELGDVCIKLDKKDTDKFYMFAKIGGRETELQPHHTGLHGWIKDRIIKKFDRFNIKFIF